MAELLLLIGSFTVVYLPDGLRCGSGYFDTGNWCAVARKVNLQASLPADVSVQNPE